MCCIKFDPKKSISQSRVAWVGVVRFTFNFQSVSMAHISPNQPMLFASQKQFPNFGSSKRHTYQFHELQDGTMYDQMMTRSPFNISVLDPVTIPKLFPFVYINCCHVQFNSNQPRLQPQNSRLQQLVES